MRNETGYRVGNFCRSHRFDTLAEAKAYARWLRKWAGNVWIIDLQTNNRISEE
jgi:hypothetical protein